MLSTTFRTLEYARTWAYSKNFEDISYLIKDKEDDVYYFVNSEKLSFLQGCFDLDMEIIEVWE